MTALQAPADDAPASEWGTLAFSIPGWPTKYEQPREQLVDDDGIEWIYSDQSDWFSGGSGHPVPNPDHDGTAGCLLALLGAQVFSVWMAQNWREGDDERIGRACIRVAASIGRWPGRSSAMKPRRQAPGKVTKCTSREPSEHPPGLAKMARRTTERRFKYQNSSYWRENDE